ncbi:MAG TPA: hypothetical protein VF461_05705 [Gemmatimonadaceae bacterium]
MSIAREVIGILYWLGWGAAIIALLNLVAFVALIVAYAWHDGLKQKLRGRRARRQAFERLLAQSSFDNLSTISESSNAGEWWEW